MIYKVNIKTCSNWNLLTRTIGQIIYAQEVVFPILLQKVILQSFCCCFVYNSQCLVLFLIYHIFYLKFCKITENNIQILIQNKVK